MSHAAIDYTRCSLRVAAESYDVALAALMALPLRGWQEDETTATLTFWLAGDEDAARVACAGLAGLGELTRTPEPGGWEDAWRRFHQPVTIAGVTMRPPWSPPVAGTLDVEVAVGMAFGTGGHPTTRQCLTALAGVPAGERHGLLDAGTGSGVLALAGLRLGYEPVCACDDDPTAVAEAVANARRNGLALDVRLADIADESMTLPAAGTLVANISLNPLVALGERCAAALAAGGAAPHTVILAGLLEAQVAAGEAAFRGFSRRHLDRDGEWACLVLEVSR